eukprot:TRINITY_DN12377_c0_g1_i1.p1 TRINITY_DN12377_c0_g1~~TRINITY_DN12377_c0_g1_i1.p1  ORF type:complete len:810 (+),score=133.77 TRINITY_DN12377_c0_g1_i1:90-2519(+)
MLVVSPELQGYAENIWRRFPEVFISLGSPDVEDYYDLGEDTSWYHKVTQTKSQKVIEIILPRRSFVFEDDDDLDGPSSPELTPRCEDMDEDILMEIDQPGRAEFDLGGRVEETVSREVRHSSQGATTSGHDDHRSEGVGHTPAESSKDQASRAAIAAPSPVSGVTMIHAAVAADESTAIEGTAAGLPSTGLSQSAPLSSVSYLPPEPLPPPLDGGVLPCDGSACTWTGGVFGGVTTSSIESTADMPRRIADAGKKVKDLPAKPLVSNLAMRRGMVLSTVITQRTPVPGSVKRRPSLDRTGSGDSVPLTHSATSRSAGEVPIIQEGSVDSVPLTHSATSRSWEVPIRQEEDGIAPQSFHNGGGRSCQPGGNQLALGRSCSQCGCGGVGGCASSTSGGCGYAVGCYDGGGGFTVGNGSNCGLGSCAVGSCVAGMGQWSSGPALATNVHSGSMPYGNVRNVSRSTPAAPLTGTAQSTGSIQALETSPGSKIQLMASRRRYVDGIDDSDRHAGHSITEGEFRGAGQLSNDGGCADDAASSRWRSGGSCASASASASGSPSRWFPCHRRSRGGEATYSEFSPDGSITTTLSSSPEASDVSITVEDEFDDDPFHLEPGSPPSRAALQAARYRTASNESTGGYAGGGNSVCGGACGGGSCGGCGGCGGYGGGGGGFGGCCGGTSAQVIVAAPTATGFNYDGFGPCDRRGMGYSVAAMPAPPTMDFEPGSPVKPRRKAATYGVGSCGNSYGGGINSLGGFTCGGNAGGCNCGGNGYGGGHHTGGGCNMCGGGFGSGTCGGGCGGCYGSYGGGNLYLS